MLAAIRTGDWRRAMEHEDARRLLISALRELSNTHSLPSADQRRKTPVLKRILQVGAEMRESAEPAHMR